MLSDKVGSGGDIAETNTNNSPVVDVFEKEKNEIVNALDEAIKSQYGSSTVYQMIKPYFGKSGKKLRPLISVYVYRLIVGDNAPLDKIKPILSSIEIAHNASLIVDDVFDRDRLRRGDLSFFVKYGTFAALSIAYNLSAFVFDLATRTNHAEVVRTVGSAASELSAALYLSKDLRSKQMVSEEFFMDVLKKKTSSLFKSASKSAALLATKERDVIEVMTKFGEYYGNAYQLRDDVLAIEGTFDDLGKEPDSDIVNRFQSLITINAMKNATIEDLDILNRFYLKHEDIDHELIRQILIRSGGTETTKVKCLEYRQKCLDILDLFIDSNAKDKLTKLLMMINFD
jgi:geranylgeranyl pyrophosphate synthase